MVAPINKKKSPVTVEVSTDTIAAVQRIADHEEQSRADVWRRLIRRGLEVEQRSAEAGR